jgi:hypothetical protein
MFDRFLKKARSKGMTLVPLGALLRENTLVEEASVERGVIHGRDGWLSIQV